MAGQQALGGLVEALVPRAQAEAERRVEDDISSSVGCVCAWEARSDDFDLKRHELFSSDECVADAATQTPLSAPTAVAAVRTEIYEHDRTHKPHHDKGYEHECMHELDHPEPYELDHTEADEPERAQGLARQEDERDAVENEDTEGEEEPAERADTTHGTGDIGNHALELIGWIEEALNVLSFATLV